MSKPVSNPGLHLGVRKPFPRGGGGIGGRLTPAQLQTLASQLKGFAQGPGKMRKCYSSASQFVPGGENQS